MILILSYKNSKSTLKQSAGKDLVTQIKDGVASCRPMNEKHMCIQWNLVIKRSDITKPSYNKVILLVPALYISLFFTLI